MEKISSCIRSYIAKNILFSKNGYPYADDVSLLEEGILDSMNVIELVSFIENEFGVTVNDLDIVPDNFDSVDKMSAFVMRKAQVFS